MGVVVMDLRIGRLHIQLGPAVGGCPYCMHDTDNRSNAGARGKNTHPPLENATARECNGCNAWGKQRLCGRNGCMQVQRLLGSATACNAWEK
jgi:hypothetical protein